MKTVKILSLLAASVVGANAYAVDGKIAFGPQGGAVFTRDEVENRSVGQNIDNATNFMAGVFFEFGIWTITLRPELNYVEKGYTYVGVAKVKHKFLEIPVLLKFNPLSDAVVSPFFVVGPSWSRRMSSSVTVLGATTTINDRNRDWDIAGVAGLGVEFNVSENIGLAVQGRYNFGFRDQNDTNTTEIKGRDIYAMAGLTFQY